MRLYVIGPVTGREGLNRAAFEEARAKLEQAGYTVTIPHDFIPSDASHERAMQLSLCWIASARGDVAMLDDWDESPGALLENRVATACGLQAHCVGAWLLMAGVCPENDSPEETQNPPSDGAPAPSDEVLGALTRRMDETNALLRAVYYQIGAGIALDAAFMKGGHVEEAKKTALANSIRAEAYFDDAGEVGK